MSEAVLYCYVGQMDGGDPFPWLLGEEGGGERAEKVG